MGDLERNKRECIEFFERQRLQLKIVKTIVCPNGQVIDWIPIESQGNIADPPGELQQCGEGEGKDLDCLAELEEEGVDHGRVGTVPVLRRNLGLVDFTVSLRDYLSKQPEPAPQGQPGRSAVGAQDEESRINAAIASRNWLVNCTKSVRNLGGQGQFSCFKPAVESANDSSLIQVVVGNYVGGGFGRQTVEAGWQVAPSRYGDYAPHLFTYFNTRHYGDTGDGVGGWNQDFKGWVQVDAEIHPGTTFYPWSTVKGPQYRLWMAYKLFKGNRWLWVKDRWIGFYPASLFFPSHGDPQSYLGDHADHVSFKGEVFDATTPNPGVTTTDMGSGQFLETHWTCSAYIHNLCYIPLTCEGNHRYDLADISQDDQTRYRVETHFDGGDPWNSYVWLGGPGAG